MVEQGTPPENYVRSAGLRRITWRGRRRERARGGYAGGRFGHGPRMGAAGRGANRLARAGAYELTDGQAATLPTAAMTALRSLEIAGLLVSKRVLVTGANGGVGRFAIQLAVASGARVTALVRNADRAPERLRRLGAAAVVERLDSEFDSEFDVILDAVGGATFGLAIEHVAPRGVVVNIATPSHDDTVTFRGNRFDRAHGARIYTLNLFDELRSHASAASDLARLCRLMVDGRLDAQIEFEGPWRQAESAIEALLHRRIGGKAVLLVDH